MRSILTVIFIFTLIYFNDFGQIESCAKRDGAIACGQSIYYEENDYYIYEQKFENIFCLLLKENLSYRKFNRIKAFFKYCYNGEDCLKNHANTVFIKLEFQQMIFPKVSNFFLKIEGNQK